MLIHELAQTTGLSIDTIRFYEKQGLLDESHFERGQNGYRHYSDAAVSRLNLVRIGQAIGFTLSEMRQAIHAWETDELTLDEKEHYLYLKLEEIEQKMKALNEMKDFISQKIRYMRAERDMIVT
ncbi:MAG: MerR family transcriptional regulator [Anaerolineae bacterium]